MPDALSAVTIMDRGLRINLPTGTLCDLAVVSAAANVAVGVSGAATGGGSGGSSAHSRPSLEAAASASPGTAVKKEELLKRPCHGATGRARGSACALRSRGLRTSGARTLGLL